MGRETNHIANGYQKKKEDLSIKVFSKRETFSSKSTEVHKRCIRCTNTNVLYI